MQACPSYWAITFLASVATRNRASRRGIGGRGDLYGDARVILVGAAVVHEGQEAAQQIDRRQHDLADGSDRCAAGAHLYVRAGQRPVDRECAAALALTYPCAPRSASGNESCRKFDNDG